MSIARQMQIDAARRRKERLAQQSQTSTSDSMMRAAQNRIGQGDTQSLQTEGPSSVRDLTGSPYPMPTITDPSRPQPKSTIQMTRQPTNPTAPSSGQQAPVDNFGAPSSLQPQPPQTGGTGNTIGPDTGGIPHPSIMQRGDQPGDAAYTTPEQVASRIAAIRRGRGLPPQPESDQIWIDRILSGQASIGDARTAISQKAARKWEQQNIEVPEMQEMPEFEPGFDFNPEYERAMNQIQAQEAQLRSEQELAQRRMNEDAQRNIRDINEWRDDSLEANTESMADRGLVHSGINIGQQAEIGEDYNKNLEQVNQALARGEEDLARHLAQQFNQLNLARQDAERYRAEAQAAIEEARSMHEAINATPQPTAAGRYPLDDIQITDQAMQNAGADAQYFQDPNKLGSLIENIFDTRGVPIQSSAETDWERIARITEDVAAGRRGVDNVRDSVDRIARQMGLI
jgi:hypothetical protein